MWTRSNYVFSVLSYSDSIEKRQTDIHVYTYRRENVKPKPLIIKKLITFFIYPIHTDGHIALVYTSGSLEVKLNPRNSRKVSTVGLELKESPSVQNLRSETELLGRNASVASKSSNLPL